MKQHPLRGAPARRLVLALAASLLPHGKAAGAEWAATFGGATAGEGVHAVAETASGDIVVAASTDAFGTATGDSWLIRLDAGGNVISQSVAGNPAPGGVDGAVVLPGGGAVFASRNVRDFFLIHDATITRVASDGTPTWTTDIASSPTGRFFINDIVAASDGTFVGVGQASLGDAGPFVGWLIRLDADGSVLWQQYHGGVVGTDLSFDAGVETSDGGLAVTGWVASGGGEDAFVAKATAGGALTWAQSLGGASAERGNAIVEHPDGGFGVAGSTDSFTASGHAGWVLRLDAAGGLLWHAVLGDAEWSDLQAITLDASGGLVVLGRISEPGFATNDLWALQLDAASGAIGWQRAYEGDSGDYAAEATLLGDGGLLLAGTWGWGFPEEDLWLLRTDALGRIPDCGLARATAVTPSSPRVTGAGAFLPPHPPFGVASAGTVVTSASALSATTQCASSACPALLCDAIVVDPLLPCEGTRQSLTLQVGGGVPPMTVTWDLDGDTVPETPGNPVLATLPAGTTSVTAFATDSCGSSPATCRLALDVEVLPAVDPGEVSDVRGGAAPLRVSDRGARLTFEDLAGATAYSLYAGAIGTWYAPGPSAGSACFIATSPEGAGLLETAPALAANTWLVVTASNACAEGSAGSDSFGAARMSSGAWPLCGPAP